jgi:hypothetical protein
MPMVTSTATTLSAMRMPAMVFSPTPGKSTESVKIIDRMTRAKMTAPVNRLRRRESTHGPSTASSGSGRRSRCRRARARSGAAQLPHTTSPSTGRRGTVRGLVLPKAFERARGGHNMPMTGQHRPLRAAANCRARGSRSIVVARSIDRWRALRAGARAQQCVIGEFGKHRSPPLPRVAAGGERKADRSGPIGLVHAASRAAVDLDVAGPHRLARGKRDGIPGATAHFAVVSGE